MADVAASFKSWSSTVGSNLPSSSTTIGAGLAPNFQQIQATLRTELGSRSTALTASATTDLNTKDEGTVLVSNASGTIAITSFGTVSAGIKKLITFSVTGGSLSLIYNATSMILPSSANISVSNGDSLFAESLGAGNWKIHAYFKAVGMAGLDDVVASSKIQPIATGIASNALTITLSPTVLDFRSQTLNDGLVTTIKSATNQSINLPTGASLGFTSGISGRMAVLAFNNGGSILLGVANVLGQSLDESDLKTTTVISGSSTAINAVYTNAGSLGANAYRVVGYVDATWVSGLGWTAVQKTQGAGGVFNVKLLTDGATVTAAGTAIDVTPIPSWVKKLTIKFHEVSTNGTANYQIQLGSASVQQTGYTSALSRTGSNAVATGNVFTGFGINSVNASNLLSGVIQITRSPNNIYECFGMLSDNSGGAYFVSGGVTLSGLLDRIRITTTASDSFDNGSFDFFYE